MKMRQRLLGFTLIELMIALTIIGILVSVAYPSYMNSVRKSNRTEAKAELMDAAQRLQRCYTAYGSFTVSPGNACKVFAEITEGLVSQGAGYYEIGFDGDPTPTAYTLKATAIKAPQDSDEDCQEMTLTSVGVKEPADCW